MEVDVWEGEKKFLCPPPHGCVSKGIPENQADLREGDL